MEFRVLGPVEMGPVDAPVALRGHRRRGVLAVLLLRANRVVSTAELVQTLWAEPTPAAESNVRTQVTELRRLLDKHDDMPGRLMTEASGYRLMVGPDELDLTVFEALAAEGEEALRQGASHRALEVLERAQGLWRGPALDGTSSSTALAAEADRLEERRLAVTELLADAAIATGRAADAVADLRALVAANPLRERATALLMTALAEAGEPAAALTAYQDVRAALVERLGTDPSPDLLRLYERILRNEPVREPTDDASTVPRQLPVMPPGFTGRQAELDSLNGLLDQAGESGGGTVVISAIGGMAGIGKTSLAVRWAHQVTDRFTDGQLFVNLRGFAPSGAAAVTPAAALRGFLDAFGVPPERIPTGLDAQAALYRSRTAGKKLLILLDNARDEQQVRPLLPGTPGCLVLVTSRNRLTGLTTTEGAAPLALDLLTDADARDLLARRLGARRVDAEPAAVAQIIELCARLPLALAIVAARATEHPDLSLAVLAAQLRDSRDRLDALDSGDEATSPRAVFSWSYQALSPDAGRLFRLLGLHPGPDISAPAAASLAALPLADVQPLLRELVRANLLTEHTPDRYSFHDLLRTYAAELTDRLDTDTERDAATDRMLDHYLHTAHTGRQVLNSGRPPITLTGDPISLEDPEPGAWPETLTTFDQAMAWFTRERPVLLAVVIDGAAAAGADKRTWQLAWAFNIFLQLRGHWNDWITIQQAAVTAAHRLDDWAAEVHMRTLLATAHIEMGQLDEARTHLRGALELATQAGDQTRQARVHITLARTWGNERRPDSALDHSRQALALYRSTGNRNGEAYALNAIGWYHDLIGDHHDAVTSCEQALALFQELDNRHGQAVTWDSLGHTHHHLGHHRQALTCYHRALDLYQDFGDRGGQGETLVRLGDTHHAAGNFQDARNAWQGALTIFTDLDHADADAVRARLAALDGED